MSKYKETIGNEEIIEMMKEDGINVPPTLEDYEKHNVIPPKKLNEHGIRPQNRIYILEYRNRIEQLKTRPPTKIQLIPSQERVLDYINEAGEIRVSDFERVGLKSKQHLWKVLNRLLQFGLVEKETISRKNVVYRIPVKE